MKVFLINGHHTYPRSRGDLNASLERRAMRFFKAEGWEIRRTESQKPFDVSEEIEKLKWADLVFLQCPLNWMGLPWSLKRYVDEVWSAGMSGKLSRGDGRTLDAPKANYGLGGVLDGRYMMSFTANAPEEAFRNPDDLFFRGMSEDDLLQTMHLNFRWIGLSALPTFMAYDVVKNPTIEQDFRRFDEHLGDNLKQLQVSLS